MKAYQYDNPAQGLVRKDLPIPEPDHDQVQIQVFAAGICHSDCHIVEGEAYIGHTPLTLGHEVAGVVTKLGSSVRDLKVGTRVAVAIPAHPKAMFDINLSIGLGFDGGFAEYTAAPRSRVVPIPDELSFAQAAVSTDALATSFHAVQEAGPTPGAKIGVIGLGGLGMSGLRIAALKGAEVYGFDVVDTKFPEALKLGAKACFKSLGDAEHVAFDAIVDFYGSSQTTAAAVKAVAFGGKVVGVGLQSLTVDIPAGGTSGYIVKAVSLIGSLGASMDDLKSVMEMVRAGDLKPQVTEVPFSDVPATIALLANSAGTGRYWTDPSKA